MNLCTDSCAFTYTALLAMTYTSISSSSRWFSHILYSCMQVLQGVSKGGGRTRKKYSDYNTFSPLLRIVLSIELRFGCAYELDWMHKCYQKYRPGLSSDGSILENFFLNYTSFLKNFFWNLYVMYTDRHTKYLVHWSKVQLKLRLCLLDFTWMP